MSKRRGATLLELLIVIAILAVFLGLLFPAVQKLRRHSQEATCKNNLRQINLAFAGYYDANQGLPKRGTPDKVGGWTIDILDFLEQKTLKDRIKPGGPIDQAPSFLLTQPRILTCPTRSAIDSPVANRMDHGHYVLIPHASGKAFQVFDAPVTLNVPWATGPEMAYNDVIRQTGPHRGGFFHASGFQQGVGFLLDGEELR